jgi:hypothetical protein
MGPAEASQAPGVVNLESITDPDDRLNPCNPANNVNYTVDGWPTLTKVIEQESSLEAFATFTDLNIKSLLYYQAELIYLRKELHRVEWKDFRASEDDCRSRYANNLEFLIAEREGSIASAGSENPLPLPEQWILIERIRTTLDKYSKSGPHQDKSMTNLVGGGFRKILHCCNSRQWRSSGRQTLQMSKP